jgi:acyl-CoA synthetase (AMP-forming)/AMP-acid ligase II
MAEAGDRAGKGSSYPASMKTWRDVGGWEVGRHPEVVRRARADDVWPDRTVADFAADHLQRQPDRVLVVDGGRAFSVATLHGMALRLAGWFAAEGIATGDVVSFQLPNWWEASVINLAAAMIGAVVNPIVPINRDAELTHMLCSARSRVNFIPDAFRGFDYAAMMRRVLPALDRSPRVVTVRADAADFVRLEQILAEASPLATRRAVDPEAVKLLMYTSGTTGRPKAVLHSHNSIHADGLYMNRAMGLSANDSVFCGSPLTHVSGYLWLLNQPWLSGMTAVSIDRWDQATAIQLLRDQRCSVMIGATPFLQDILTRTERGHETLPDLRHYVCGGAAVPPSLIYRAAEALPGCIPWRTFGSTETTTLTRGPSTRADIGHGAETDGQIYTVDARVVDIRTGVELPHGAEGELLVRGPGMMLGYADSADNAKAFDEDGYFRMGDLVRRTGSGHLVCTGRAKDLIIRAGENISAKEIEDVLTASFRIREAAVVSKPDARTGEAICAFLVLAPGETLSLSEVDAMFRAAGLARQKTPEHILPVDELPKTPVGKVRKDILRRIAAGASA